MQRSGFTELPLHPGKIPRWLFHREICCIAINEFGSKELLKRLSNLFFFQALACIIGFDWHSSGTTTTAYGALTLSL